MPGSKRKAAIVVVAASLVAVMVLGPSSASAAPSLADKLVSEVRVGPIARHLEALQARATRNGDTRAAGTPGYDASLNYAKRKLQAAGFRTTVQTFPFTFFQELAERLTVAGTDYPVDVMTYSPSTPVGGITAPLAATPTSDATPGCETGDFTALDVTGKVVVIPRGACTFAVKQQNAAAAGAIGAVISNNDLDPNVVNDGTLGDPNAAVIPTASTSRAAGDTLRTLVGSAVTLELRTLTEARTSANLIADWPFGNKDQVVMAGAHLDSVLAGPGINDNGSGSAALLETALQFAEHAGRRVPNHVRFAWWGAEESSLVGSNFYVSQLTEPQRLAIALYLNFDMIGSPNFTFGIYDGDDSDAVGAGPGPAGSAEVEDVFEQYFDSRSLADVGTDFTGRSDYGPFIAAGIPSGGLFTGAEGIKTPAEAAQFGGLAGVPYDPCYHQACDSMTPVDDGADAGVYSSLGSSYRLLGNVNLHALGHNADALAYAVGTFATSVATLPAAPRTAGEAHAVGAPTTDR